MLLLLTLLSPQWERHRCRDRQPVFFISLVTLKCEDQIDVSSTVMMSISTNLLRGSQTWQSIKHHSSAQMNVPLNDRGRVSAVAGLHSSYPLSLSATTLQAEENTICVLINSRCCSRQSTWKRGSLILSTHMQTRWIHICLITHERQVHLSCQTCKARYCPDFITMDSWQLEKNGILCILC